ncbi:MAG: hypothetical protein LBU65_16670 [Planctomycetaceae bacterium]|nr:hypothetical protein [Planctomycetaceae bacterium]
MLVTVEDCVTHFTIVFGMTGGNVVGTPTMLRWVKSTLRASKISLAASLPLVIM